jgi:hypothetical protein
VIAFELLTGHFPWRNVGSDDDDALRAEIRSGKVELPDFLSPLAASLLKGLLEKVVPRRLGYFTSNQVSVRFRDNKINNQENKKGKIWAFFSLTLVFSSLFL